MLGHTVKSHLLSYPKDIQVQHTTVNGNFDSIAFRAGVDKVSDLIKKTNPEFIINCIGIIKPRIDQTSTISIENAIKVNSLFPYELERAADDINAKVIQIATDCVFSGNIGSYDESANQDAVDVYGKTKSLGEVNSSTFLNLRCSIIGLEFERSTSLLEWVKNQPKNAKIDGYTNHDWNGITTLQFAKIVFGIIQNNDFRSGSLHVIPNGHVSKFELVHMISTKFHRSDIEIRPTSAENYVNRTLKTIYPEWNSVLWHNAGYSKIPTIEDMLQEVSDSWSLTKASI